jgi:hypothetical protein
MVENAENPTPTLPVEISLKKLPKKLLFGIVFAI